MKNIDIGGHEFSFNTPEGRYKRFAVAIDGECFVEFMPEINSIYVFPDGSSEPLIVKYDKKHHLTVIQSYLKRVSAKEGVFVLKDASPP